MATTPGGQVIVANTPDQLRRAVRQIDGTTTADTTAFPAVGHRDSNQR